MTWWIGYARAGREFRVASAIRRLGAKVRLGRRADAKRVPTKRLPRLVRAPYLPNYIFIDATDEQWHAIHAAQARGYGPLKHLAPTMTLVPNPSRRGVIAFLDALDADYRARLRRHREGEKVGRYEPGESIRLLEGSLAGQLATFVALVDASGFDRDVKVEAEVGTLGGVPLRIRVDALHVTRAAVA